MHKINGKIEPQLKKRITWDRFKEIEDGLEKLSIQMIAILKEHRKRGIIGEKEYKKHIRYKKDFLRYLNNKRQKIFTK